MQFLKLSVVVAGLSAGAVFAQANDPAATPRVDQRQAEQQQRINQGVASGQLTPREANKLQRGQAKVAAAESKAKADGVVTRKERAKLERMQDKQSQKIARQKHDAQHR